MKRIILGISVLLILVQNVFSYTDKEFDIMIANASSEHMKQGFRCDKIASNHSSTGDVSICLKALEIDKKRNSKKENIAIDYLNVGVIYDHQNNKLKAYEYFMKSAKLGNITAQKNLDIICKKSPWACK